MLRNFAKPLIITLGCALLGSDAHAAVATNDAFAERTWLEGGFVSQTGTLQGATLEAGEPVHGAPGEAGSVWWGWTAPTAGSVSVHAEAPYAFVTVAVYRGDTLDHLERVASDSDGDGWYAQVSFWTEAGQTYAIAVASGFIGDSTVLLQIRPGPTNDRFDQRTTLPKGPLLQNGSTLGALVEADEPAFGLGPLKGTVWYDWSPDHSGGWELRLTAGSPPDWAAAVAVLASGDRLTNQLARAWVEAPREAVGSVSFRAVADEPLHLQVNTRMDGGTPFRIQFIAGPDNDDFDQRREITSLSQVQSGTTVGATREPGEPTHGGGTAPRTVWWTWTAPTTGGYYVETSDPSSAPFLGVYRGAAIDQLTAVAADPLWVPGTVLRRAFHAVAGESFAIVVSDASVVGRAVGLTLFPGPANDDFVQATRIENTSAPVNGTCLGATVEPGQPVLGSETMAPVWYRWRAPTAGGFVARVLSPEAPAGIAIFRGDQLAALQEVQRTELRVGESLCAFHAESGMDHAIAVFGSGVFTLELLPTASNDDWVMAPLLTAETETNAVTAFLASREPGEPVVGSLTNAGSLWWRWRAPVTRGYEVEATHAYASSALAVFVGEGPGDLQVVAPPIEVGGAFSRVQFHAIAGVEYSFGLWIAGTSEGCALTVRPGLDNDDFHGRILLTGATATQSQTFHGASLEPGEPAAPAVNWGDAGSAWYEWTAPVTGSYFLRGELLPAADLALVVWRGTNWPLAERVGWATFSTVDRRVRLGFTAIAGTTYSIAALASPLDYDATLTIQILPGPPNDSFDAREWVAGETVITDGTTAGATREPGEPELGGRTEGASTWFHWVAPRDGLWAVSVLPSTTHRVQVFVGSTLATLQSAGTNVSSQVRFNAVAGVDYQIAVDSTVEAMGAFTLRLGPPPPNDAFVDRIVLAGTNLAVAGYNLHATAEPFEAFDSSARNSVWWTWTPPADGLVRFALQTTDDVRPGFAAFTAVPGIAETNIIAATPLRSTNRIEGSFPVVVGRAYDLRVGTGAGDSTNLLLSLAFEPRPALSLDWMNQGSSWLLGGSEAWFVQTNIAHTGADALQSGPLPPASGTGVPWSPSQPETWLQAVFHGPGTLDFWWKTSSARADFLSFSIAEPVVVVGPWPVGWSLSGLSDWTHVTVNLSRRTNVVRWTFSRASTAGGGLNAAWLDDVRFVPRPPAPFSLRAGPLPDRSAVDLVFTAEAQRLFAVESTTNFHDWEVLTNVANLGTNSRIFHLAPPVDPAEPGRFYRARAE